MDLRQLRSFLAVVDHGSFSAAAEALYTVQSNVSTHVARLETEVGATLLDRRTRALTNAGRIVEKRGREVMRQLTAINDDLADIENRIIGEVVCGTTPSIGLQLIPRTMAVATSTLPEVSLSIVEAHSGTLVQQLLGGDIDLAITTNATNPSLRSTPLFTEDIVAVLASSHPFAASNRVRVEDLAKTNLLLPLQDNPLYDHIARAFARADSLLRPGLAVGSSALVQEMARAQVGVALVPATAAGDVSADRRVGTVVRPIEGMDPRDVALTMNARVEQTRAVQAVAAIVEQTARQAVTAMAGCHPTTVTTE